MKKLITIYEVKNGFLVKCKNEAQGIEIWDEFYIAKTCNKIVEVVRGYLDRGEKDAD